MGSPGHQSIEKFRTAPSAGALYPLKTYILAGNVTGLAKGTYRYQPKSHALLKLQTADTRGALAAASLSQHWLEAGAVVVVLSAVYERTTRKYGQRGIRYAHIEAGHAAQNVLLQATSLNLGAAPVGAFDDDSVSRAVGMADGEVPLYVIPVGHPAA